MSDPYKAKAKELPRSFKNKVKEEYDKEYSNWYNSVFDKMGEKHSMHPFVLHEVVNREQVFGEKYPHLLGVITIIELMVIVLLIAKAIV